MTAALTPHLSPCHPHLLPPTPSAALRHPPAASDRVREPLTWKVTQFALGRPLTARDARHIRTIHNTAWKNDGTYGSLITAIVMSELVLTTQTEIHE